MSEAYQAVPITDSLKRWRVVGPAATGHHETGEYEATAAALCMNAAHAACEAKYAPLVEASRELLDAVLHGSGPYMTERAIEKMSAALQQQEPSQ